MLTSMIGHSINIRPWRMDGESNPTIHRSLIAAQLEGRNLRNAVVCLVMGKRKTEFANNLN